MIKMLKYNKDGIKTHDSCVSSYLSSNESQ